MHIGNNPLPSDTKSALEERILFVFLSKISSIYFGRNVVLMNTEGVVLAICISPTAGGQMQEVEEVEAIAGAGLKGDRYCTGEGSFNKESGVGNRQVTFINGLFVFYTGFKWIDTRRNIATSGVELMFCINKEFRVGEVIFRGVKYCEPCKRPSKLSGNPKSFAEIFFDRGGLIAEVVQGGIIRVGDSIIPPPKGYKT